MRGWLVILLCLLGAGPLCAGAFMEERGATFLSTSGTYRWNSNGARQEVAVYATHGLRRITLGADFNLIQGQSGHALVFVRLPLSRPAARARFAVEFAVGGAHQSGLWAPMTRIALAHGRGWDRGWYDVSLMLEHRSGQPVLGWKLDGTIGLNGAARLQPMMQIGLGRGTSGVREWRVSAHLRLAARNGRTWVLGVERKVAGAAATAITLALWRRF